MRPALRMQLREEVRDLFYHGFNNYMEHAFPEDELRPLTCAGRGKDRTNHANLGINDVCGDFSLTLIDSLDTLCILGDQPAFALAVRNVIDSVTFDVDSNVQVFEVTIRVLGGLLSAHQYAADSKLNCTIPWYNGELLDLAHDLGLRLLPAFSSPTGIPYPRINLKHGMKGLFPGASTETCSAGAGSLLLEFALLSRLTSDWRFEKAASTAFRAIWDRRMELGLVGNTIDANSGQWTSSYTSVGAGIDSFYEYALKAWVFLGDDYYYDVWNHSRRAITNYIIDEDGVLLRNIHLRTGFQLTHYIDSLSAYYPGLLVLAGDVEQATKIHLVYQSIWTRYGALPERYNFNALQIEIPWYPLRPEFIESTYFLYRATKDPFYLAIGRQLVADLTKLKKKCGFAVLTSVLTGRVDDRMESFMLSETLKYLYLLFDEDNPLNSLHSNWIFTTEGHPLFPVATAKHLSGAKLPFSPQDRCEVPIQSNLHSAVMSRRDVSYIQTKIGLVSNESVLPHYFPPLNPNVQSLTVRKRTDMEVLFGTVASTMVNASASFVQIGRDLVIKSLLGLKIKFERENATWRATKVGDIDVSNETEVVITDPMFEQYITPDLVHFTNHAYDTRIELTTSNGTIKVIDGMSSQSGTSLPATDTYLTVVSMLDTSNANGCLCPAIFDKQHQDRESSTSAIIVSRGGCSFLDKSLNAHGQARVVVVVDQSGNTPSYVKPSLVDDAGTPMPADQDYPSLILVEDSSHVRTLHEAQSLVFRDIGIDATKVKLILKGEEVHNVEVSID